MKYKIPTSVFIQEVDNEVIILDTNTQEYFSINEVGKDIWDAISKDLTTDEVLEELKEIYEVPETQLKTDMQNFLDTLEQKGLITKD